MTLVAGGTGGHVLPAVAFGEWAGRAKPGVKVNYVSGSRPVELEIYKANGIEPFVLRVSGSPAGASGFLTIKRCAELSAGFAAMWRRFGKIRPDVCVMFGGYASLPALFAAKVRGIKSVIHEQNSRAGRVTKIASFLRVPVASGWRECEGVAGENFTYAGVPVRRFDPTPKAEAWKILRARAKGDGPVVAVMTGSLGSDFLLRVVDETARRENFSSWNFFIVDPSVESPSQTAPNVTRLPRMWNIAPLYAVSDMLITRCGASTLTETLALGLPAVAAPWRGAADDHQMKNAMTARSRGKIEIWDESGDDADGLCEKLKRLYSNYGGRGGEGDRMLYNANDAGEKICARLWHIVTGEKGEVCGGR
jgi:UDP-N-acetylglucosamine--N-acetylmuramyl-(pentapeptide) pyrophosphoryl-undecaprenol N-acetylglucosamine transferase